VYCSATSPSFLFESSDDESDQSPVWHLLRDCGYSSFYDAPSAIGQTEGPVRADGRSETSSPCPPASRSSTPRYSLGREATGLDHHPGVQPAGKCCARRWPACWRRPTGRSRS